MSISRSRQSRVFTISFPEELASQVEDMAQRESRNISELFREAFRRYRLQNAHQELEAARLVARARNPRSRYQAKDVEFLVDEVRSARKRKKK